MVKKIAETENEEDLAFRCQLLAGRGNYQEIFKIFQTNPDILNYLTFGELGRYIRGYKTTSQDKLAGHNLKILRRNVESIIFGDKK